MHNIIWKGARRPIWEGNLVTMKVDDGEFEVNLPVYLDEVNHSPDGFEWGYAGSGPAQLAYAILRSYFEIAVGLTPEEAKQKALKEYYNFKVDIVCNHFGRSERWELTSDDIRIWRMR